MIEKPCNCIYSWLALANEPTKSTSLSFKSASLHHWFRDASQALCLFLMLQYDMNLGPTAARYFVYILYIFVYSLIIWY